VDAALPENPPREFQDDAQTADGIAVVGRKEMHHEDRAIPSCLRDGTDASDKQAHFLLPSSGGPFGGSANFLKEARLGPW